MITDYLNQTIKFANQNAVLFAIMVFGILFGIFALLMLFLTPKKPTSQPVSTIKKATPLLTSKDIRAIAGDDVMVTQLDLARAYIELGKKNIAKQILENVTLQGNQVQKQEAQQLLSAL